MGVARVYKVGSPYNGVELDDIDFKQTADTMYLVHIDHAVNKLLRHAHDDWEFVEVTFGPAISAPTGLAATATTPNTDADNAGAAYFPQPASYVVTAVNDDTGQESRASNSGTADNDLDLKKNYNTITWTATDGATRYNVYKADNSQFYGYIGTTDDTTFRDDNIGPDLTRAPPQASNPFDGVGNYPSSVTFMDQRLMLGRTQNVPNGIWGSRAGTSEYENFDVSQPMRDSDAVSFAIVSDSVNAINNLVSSSSLLALTSDAIFKIDGDGNGGVLTANSQSARRQIGRGSSRLPPIVVDNVVFYSPSTGSSVRTINYSFEQDGLQSNDVSIFSPHFFVGFSIVSWCYAQEPRSIIWAVRSDGKLLCFTWEQEQNVWGWTLCETDGVVLSCCSIVEDGEDRVYLIVRRTINGVDRTFIERMASAEWDDVSDSCYVDCAITQYVDQPQTEFTGLWHLDGATVDGLVDGVVVTGLTVQDGKVTLPAMAGSARVATFGLPYQVDVETLPVRAQAPGSGWNVGRKQQTGQIVLDIYQTRSILIGVDADHLYPLKQRLDEDYGAPDALMTGNYPMDSANVVSGDVSVHVRQTAPLPMTLVGVFMDPIIGG